MFFLRPIRFVALLFVALFVLPTALFAQVNTPSSPTSTFSAITVATVNVHNAKILSQQGNSVIVGFDITNSVGAQAEIHYALSLYKMSEKNRILVDRKVSEKVLSLSENDFAHIEMPYVAPRDLSGKYALYVEVENSAGLNLGTSRLGDVTLSGSEKRYAIDQSACALIKGQNGETHEYNISQPVLLDTNDTLELRCSVVNLSQDPLRLSPVVHIMSGAAIAGSEKTETLQEIVLPALGSDTLKVPLASRGVASGVYYATVSFSIGNDIGSYIVPVLKYMVAGEAASVQNVVLDKDRYAKGESAKISYFWVKQFAAGEQDQLIVGSLKASVSGSSGLCGESGKQTLEKNQFVGEIAVPITNDCKNPIAKIALSDTNGKLITSREFAVKSKDIGSKRNVWSFEKKRFISFYFIIMLFVIGFMLRSMRKRKIPPEPPSGSMFLFLPLLVLIGIFGFADSAKANTVTFFVAGSAVTASVGDQYYPGEQMSYSLCLPSYPADYYVTANMTFPNGNIGSVNSVGGGTCFVDFSADVSSAAPLGTGSYSIPFSVGITRIIDGNPPIDNGGTTIAYAVVSPPLPNVSCGSDNGQTIYASQPNSLCDVSNNFSWACGMAFWASCAGHNSVSTYYPNAAVSSALSENASGWTWSCSNAYSPTVACSANKPAPQPATCGYADGNAYPSQPPASSLCNSGDTASAVTSGGANGPWTWTCTNAVGPSGLCTATYNVTPPPPPTPTVTTDPATAVTSSVATLNATVNPNGDSSVGWFRYGTTDPGNCTNLFGTRIPGSSGTDLGSGSVDVSYSRNVTGLSSNTTYYYCAGASNSGGVIYGSVRSFTTASPPKPDLISSDFTLPSWPSYVVGLAIPMKAKAKNIGTGNASGGFSDRFYTQRNGGSWNGYGSAVPHLTLNIGSTANDPISGTLDYAPGISGTYYFRHCVDTPPPVLTGSVIELDETNNCDTSAPYPVVNPAGSPDYRVVDLAVSGSPWVGNTLTFSGHVQNIGNAVAPNAAVRFCIDNVNCLNSATGAVGGLSWTDGAFPTSDDGAHSRNLALCVGEGCPNLAAGPHTITMCVDVTKVVPEAKEDNNCMTVPFPIYNGPPIDGKCKTTHYACLAGASVNNISGPASWTWTCQGINGSMVDAVCAEAKSLPDLIVSVDAAPDFAPIENQPVPIRATVKNIGNSIASGPFDSIIQVDYDANHAVVNTTLATNALSNIGILATGQIVGSYTFPSAGTYYIRACADNNAMMVGTVNEGLNEGNNCSGSWTVVTVAPVVGPTVTLIAHSDTPEGTVGSSVFAAVGAYGPGYSVDWTISSPADSCTLMRNGVSIPVGNTDGSYMIPFTSAIISGANTFTFTCTKSGVSGNTATAVITGVTPSVELRLNGSLGVGSPPIVNISDNQTAELTVNIVGMEHCEWKRTTDGIQDWGINTPFPPPLNVPWSSGPQSFPVGTEWVYWHVSCWDALGLNTNKFINLHILPSQQPPVIDVTPSSATYSTPAGVPKTITYTVSNTVPAGGQNLVISNIQVNGNGFSCASGCSGFPITISPQGSATFQVSFLANLPTTPQENGTVSVMSNDPLQPTKFISLIGVATTPLPSGTLDFGAVKVNTPKSMDLTITNTTAVDLGTVHLQTSGAPFVCTSGCVGTLSPNGGSFTATITFTPDKVSQLSGVAGLVEYSDVIYTLTGIGTPLTVIIKEQ